MISITPFSFGTSIISLSLFKIGSSHDTTVSVLEKLQVPWNENMKKARHKIF